MSLAELLAAFSNQAEVSTSSVTDPTDSDVLLEYPLEPSAQEAELRAEISQLQQEYQRLQTRLEQERDQVQQEFQQSSLQVLESWLIQFPTAAYAAQQNPQVSATKLLPLMRPVEQLIQAWGVEAIAPVGSEVDYDPHLHQLMDGAANAGDRVKVRYTGYRQGNKLLFRAKVSPVV
jgi:molecular chaperone GrpE (heat shock protein)